MEVVRVIRRYFYLLARDPMNTEVIRELRGLALTILGLMALYEVLMIAEMYPLRWFIDEFSRGFPSHLYLLNVNLLMLVVAWTVNFVHAELTIRRVKAYWRNWRLTWGYGHWRQLHLCTAWHVAHSTGEKESVVSKNVNKIENMIDALLWEGAPTLARIVIITGFVCWLHPLSGAVIVAGLVAFTVILLRNNRLDEPRNKAFRQEIKAIESEGTELVQNWWTIKQMRLEDEFASQHIDSLTRLVGHEDVRFPAFERDTLKQAWFIALMRFAVLLAIIDTFQPGGGLGIVFLIFSFAERMFSNLHRLTEPQRHLREGVAGMREYSDVLAAEPTVKEIAAPRFPAHFRGQIEYRQVSFSYPGKDDQALSDVSFTIPADGWTALVGHSGSGKTTVVKLLERAYDATGGQILIDGLPIGDYDLKQYLRRVGVVSQKYRHLNATVAENIDFLRGYSREDIISAARRAHAHDFILAHGGYDAPMGEDGIHLSGGESQRIAIARALVGNPTIIIFDEATSSLDAETQGIVQETLNKVTTAGEVTVVVIAHRLSTIRNADQIIVFDRGKIVEVGTHESLMAIKNSHYRKLVLEELRSFGVRSDQIVANLHCG